jgi:protein involved in polysaccharide export with SLBB domain
MATLRALVAAAATLWCAGCSATGYSVVDLAESINATRYVGAPVLQSGDVVKVTFLTKSDWNQEVRLRPDGKGAFLGLDDVALVGLTLAQADELLTGLYAKVNTDTPVERPLSVDLAGTAGGAAGESVAAAGAAYVVGEVRAPGPITLAGPTMTVTDAIAAAGAHLKASANLRNVILIRRLASGEMRSWRLDLDIYEWGKLPPIYMQPRDVVFVPNTAVDEVNIWIDKYIRQNLPLPFFPPV